MIGHWIAFSLIVILIPFAVVGFKMWVFNGKKLTTEQEKRINTTLGYYIFFYWLCDLFYMSCFINNIPCQIIFGGIIMLIFLINVYKAVSFPKDRTSFETWGILLDFIIGVSISIYLLSLIENPKLKEISIPVVASIYGGIITLVGVSLTIKKADKDRKEDEIKKARPIFAFNMLRQEPKLDVVVQKVCISDSLEQLEVANDVYVELENSNLSSFEIKRINHDGTWVKMEGNTTILPSAKCLLNFRFIDKPECLFLEVEDILGNLYYYQLSVLYLEAKSSSGMLLHTVREIKNISIEEMEREIKEARLNAN